jgi:hypothetical protein
MIYKPSTRPVKSNCNGYLLHFRVIYLAEQKIDKRVCASLGMTRGGADHAEAQPSGDGDDDACYPLFIQVSTAFLDLCIDLRSHWIRLLLSLPFLNHSESAFVQRANLFRYLHLARKT